MAIEHKQQGWYLVSYGHVHRGYHQPELIAHIRRANHPIAEDLVKIVLNMKVGDITKTPKAFYGNIPSVNGVPRK